MTEIISPHSINLNFLEKIFRNKLEIVVDPELEKNVAKSYEIVQKSAEGDLPVYGVNTGFGKLANKIIPSEDREQLQKNLVLSHCAGIGEPLPEDVTRLMMVLKIVSLSLIVSPNKLVFNSRLKVFWYSSISVLLLCFITHLIKFSNFS